MKKKKGKINYSKKALPKPQELKVAELLARTGEDVSFVPVGPTKTPDIYYENKNWEIKTPTGSSSRTIENNVRRALRQADNIIIDLSEIHLPEEKAISSLEKISNRLGKRHNILAIRKDGTVQKVK